MTAISESIDRNGAALRLATVVNDMRAVMDDVRALANPPSSTEAQTVLYAVDVDIVNLFVNPAQMFFYGAMLRPDRESRDDANAAGVTPMRQFEARVADFLGMFLLFDLQPESPMILLHHHAEELSEVFDAIQHAMQNDVIALRNALALAAAQVVSNCEVAGGDRARDDCRAGAISEKVDELESGPLGASLRAVALEREGNERLCHVDRIEFVDSRGEPRYLPPPFDAQSGTYFPAFRQLANRLLRQMLTAPGAARGSKPERLERDAYALAQLAWVNELLAEDQYFMRCGGGQVRRVKSMMLVTGSRAIARAIRSLDLQSLIRTVRAPIGFLCHPHAERFSDASADSAAPALRTWTADNASLPEFLELLRTRLARTDDRSAVVPADWRDALDSFASALVARRDLQAMLFPERLADLDDARKRIQSTEDDIALLNETLARLSADNYFRFARIANLLAPGTSRHERGGRNIPPVRFEYYPAARAIVAQLAALGDAQPARTTAARIMQGAGVELHREDESGYTEFVCFALVALVHRNPRLAASCLGYALDRVKEWRQRGGHDRQFAYLRGDDALYLMAHAVRLMADEQRNLDEAEAFLDAAHRAWLETPQESPQAAQAEIRIACERFSIDCHRVLLEVLLNKPDPERPFGRERVAVLLRHAQSLLQQAMTEPLLYVREYCLLQVRVNALQIGLLGEFGAETSSGYPRIFQRSDTLLSIDALSGLQAIARELIVQNEQAQRSLDLAQPKPTRLMELVAAVSARVFLASATPPLPTRGRRNYGFQLDSRRFEFLMLVGERAEAAVDRRAAVAR